MKVLSLKCDNCGAQLDIAPKASTCVCSYCGGEQLVERGDEHVSPPKQEDKLDEVNLLIMNRMASERAIERFESEILEMSEERDNNIRVSREARFKKGCNRLSFVLFGITATLFLFDAYSIPLWLVIPFGFVLMVFAARVIGPQIETAKTIEARVAAQMQPLREQIARHQAIIDSCDYVTTGE
ncbi:hypothetical protein [Janthinobacterium sp. HH01]|uniref:hypothetical protein n=1 Tax=Janthinobacterium sp. HH01 TaxID=1198452 RepID=UPI0005BE0C8F|nr:hypothetical protein [Janthinobacterium sp. HH01]